MEVAHAGFVYCDGNEREEINVPGDACVPTLHTRVFRDAPAQLTERGEYLDRFGGTSPDTARNLRGAFAVIVIVIVITGSSLSAFTFTAATVTAGRTLSAHFCTSAARRCSITPVGLLALTPAAASTRFSRAEPSDSPPRCRRAGACSLGPGCRRENKGGGEHNSGVSGRWIEFRRPKLTTIFLSTTKESPCVRLEGGQVSDRRSPLGFFSSQEDRPLVSYEANGQFQAVHRDTGPEHAS